MASLTQWLREAIAAQPWLAWAQPYVARAPDWALLAVPTLVVLLLAWVLLRPRGKSRAKPDARLSRGTAAPAKPGSRPLAPSEATPLAPPPPAPKVTPTAAPPEAQASGIPADSDDNRTVRVFISSTFIDMEGERNVLVKQTFPALRTKFRARGVEFLEIDLRWGVTEEEVQSGKTLPICLAEVDRCRPYFVGLLGERYGSLLSQDNLTPELQEAFPVLREGVGRSLTEIEIMQGVLRKRASASRALFFQRDPAWLKTLSAQERAQYETGDDADRAKLADLKARIRASGARIIEYSRPEDIGPAVEAALSELIEARFPEAEAPDAFTQTLRLHGAYARERRGLHIGAEPYLAALDQWMAKSDAPPMLITGASGGGKSTLVANWLHTWRGAHPNDIVFEHYLGASPDSADPMLLMRRLWEHLNRATGESVELPAGNAELMDVASGLAQRLAQANNPAARNGGNILIALDGLDKLSSEQNLRWLMNVPRVKLVASSLDGEAMAAALARGWTALEVKPLSDVERGEFIERTLEGWGRKLLPEQLAAILAHSHGGNPLFLKTVLDELRVSATHARLDERLGIYLGARDMPELFARVLERLEADCEPELVAKALPLIWASRAGLEETEIMAITGATPLAWATLRNGLGDSLRDQAGRVAFSHDYLRHAVAKSYVETDEAKRAMHLLLAEQFSAHPDIWRRAEEWPWQLERGGDAKGFEDAVFDIDSVAMFLDHGSKERLYEYWLTYDLSGGQAIATFGTRWSNYHSGIERALAAENTAYFNPKHLIVPELCRLLLQRSERGPFAAEVAEYFLEVLSFADEVDDEFRANLLNALLLTRDTGNPTRAIAAFDSLNAKFGSEWRGDGRVAFSLTGLESEIRATQNGNIADEVHVQEQLFQQMKGELGPDHRSTLIRANNLAALYSRLRRYCEAEELHRDTYARRRLSLGARAEDTLISLSNLATAILAQGRVEEAEALLNEVLSAKEATLGSNHYSTLLTAFAYAQTLIALGHTTRARDMLQEIVTAANEANLTQEAFFQQAVSTLRSLNN